MTTNVHLSSPRINQTRGESGPVRFTPSHHFVLSDSEAGIEGLADAAEVPLSVILQVTKRCNFDCSFCSETLQLPDPTLEDLDTIRGNLAGVQRVFLSGCEPLLRADFGEVVDMYHEDFTWPSPPTRHAGCNTPTGSRGRWRS